MSATVRVNGRSFTVEVVRVPLSRMRVRVGLAKGLVGRVESLAGIAQRYDASIAINGSFFDAYTPSPIKNPHHTLITNGTVVHKGNVGCMIGFNERNEVRIDRVPLSIWGTVEGDSGASTWYAYRINRSIAYDPVSEGFRHPKILSLSGARSAVGLTRDKQLLLVTCRSATVRQMASVMQVLGAYHAMNMDGGASSGLWVKGKYLTRRGREISNALLVLDR